ncbi:hypothetical protein CWI36_1288p0010 [Hamiltosporidium magnivora]|uniref:Uncharacterized protein n=1 Tax=Hamiltosporidium magnivora TaxID=148818 RepID=A0A4Q9L2L6_9MICR|nr:hypothetical protein CWI36_1288p0010 [Hamiltosporidium magnivora]
MKIERRTLLFLMISLIISLFILIAYIIARNKSENISVIFKNEYRKSSESFEFNFLAEALKVYKVSAFIQKGFLKKAFIVIYYHNDEAKNKKIIDKLLKSLDSKDQKNFPVDPSPKKFFGCQDIDSVSISKIFGSIGVLTRVGFWLKEDPILKTLREITEFIENNMSKISDNDCKYIFICTPDDKTVKLYELAFFGTGGSGFGPSKEFKFELDDGMNSNAYKYVAFLIEKITDMKSQKPKKDDKKE